MNDDDILLYADVGCHLNKEAINKFYKYLDIVIENGALCFELGHVEKSWTKSDLFNYFNVLDNKNITDTFQRAATSFLLLKNDINLNIVNKWLQVYYDDFSLADDTPWKISNSEKFIENRHDQSIFSILSKIYNFYAISYKEFETKNKNFPIHSLRDKKDIYNFVALEACDNFFDKLVWYIPERENRYIMRYNLRKYAINLSHKYLGVLKYNNDDNITLINVKIIDNFLKYLINKKIKNYIKNNRENIEEINDYVINTKSRSIK